ncbi:MAG: TadG family pilus assembly protein [Gemmatimonadaceae bacterium]
MDAQRRRLRCRLRGGGERRGAVAVIVALLLVVLVGFSAFAIDFGQTFVFRAQLQTAADAGAMAGALELLNGRDTLAHDSATIYAAHNRVSTVNAIADSVIPGSFSDATGFVARASWTDPDVNAVRVTTAHDAPYTFAPVLGLTTRTVRASAIAAVGSKVTASCMKPWAVPMENLLHALNKTGENPETYELSDEDVRYLREHTVPVAFKIGTVQNGQGQMDTASTLDVESGTLIDGNFYAVQFGPIRDENLNLYNPGPEVGGNWYKRNMGANECHSATVKPGDWLQIEQGNMAGPTRDSVAALCNAQGANGNAVFGCNPEVEVDIPIWNRYDGGREVQVAYVGKFMLQGVMQKPGGRPNETMVYGYLTAKSTPGGGFSGAPGPIMAAALVR